MTGNYGNHEQKNAQSQVNQFGGGMGVMNYNAFNQKEYEDLKEQFFKAPNLNRPPMDQYGRMGEGKSIVMQILATGDILEATPAVS